MLLTVMGFALFAWLSVTPPSQAHWADLAVADVVVNPNTTQVTLTIPTGLVPLADDNHDGRLSPQEIRRHRSYLEATLGKAIWLSSDGHTGALSIHPAKGANLAPAFSGTGGNHSTMELLYSWPQPIKNLTMHYTLFIPGIFTARCIGTVYADGKVQNVLFSPDSTEYVLGTYDYLHQALAFIHMGIDHILTGYDHILFLVSLLMMGGGLRYVLEVVSAFTVAHSITLSLTVLNLISVTPRLVECAIALTIVYVAAENFWRKSLRGRWMITMAFGLIHGMGFASALKQLDIPRSSLAVSLVSFNVGVEIGQMMIVIVAFSLLSLIRRTSWNLKFRYWVSGGVVTAGLFWFLERAFFNILT